jgi:hypothetical protein
MSFPSRRAAGCVVEIHEDRPPVLTATAYSETYVLREDDQGKGSDHAGHDDNKTPFKEKKTKQNNT